MIELAFGESPGGALKLAKSMKQGEQLSGAIAVIGGSKKEQRKAKKLRKWSGLTMEGSSKDVEALTLASMRIVVIHGQNHKGSSYHIGRMLINKIEQNKEIIEFFLPKDLNHFCLGCYKCIEDDTTCPFYNEKRKITEAIEKADLLIFTTPTYCMRASAPMKSLIDLTFTYWMVHRPRACMFGKKAVVISTAAGAGAKQAIKDVTNTLFYWGIPWIREYGICVKAMNWEGVVNKKKEKIEKHMTKLAKKLVCAGAPKVGIKTKFIFSMMGNMQKAGLGSSPVEKQYWSEQGWLNKKRPWKD